MTTTTAVSSNNEKDDADAVAETSSSPYLQIATIDGSGSSVATGLLRTLSYSGIQFIRYISLDLVNQIRCKVVPIQHISKSYKNLYEPIVAISQVCYGGMPSTGDEVITATGYTAQYSLLLQPDLSSLRILPYATNTAAVISNLYQVNSTKYYSELCTRSLLRHVIDVAAKLYNIYFTVGAEIEICLYDRTTNEPINTNNFANTTTLNQYNTYITAVYEALQQQDIQLELIHSESCYGQFEIVLRYEKDPVTLADKLLLTKETLTALSYQHNLKVIFLPKIHPYQAGNGLHFHISIYDTETHENVFTTSTPSDTSNNVGVSELGGSFVEGILQQLSSLVAFTIPTVNSLKRIGPGCWTGSGATWDYEDKECAIRFITATAGSSAVERFEYRFTDSTANVYLALSTILLAGLEGIRTKQVLRPPRNGYSTATTASTDSTAASNKLPQTVLESLYNLENNEFYKRTLSPKLLQAYIALRRTEYNKLHEQSLEEDVQIALQKA